MFHHDSAFVRFLSKMCDLVVLNLFMILFCLPIITVGACVTAGHFVALKIRRDEGHVFSNFWKSFKENFKQSTIMWLLFLVSVVVIRFASVILGATNDMVGDAFQGVTTVMLLLTIMCFLWVFPLLSKFYNTIIGTARNALTLAFKYFFRSVYMLGVCMIPLAFLFLDIRWHIFFFLFGVSVPMYLCAVAYDKVFEKIEEHIRVGD